MSQVQIRRACGHVGVGTCPHQVLAANLSLSQPGEQIMPTLYWCPHQVLKATGAPADYCNKDHKWGATHEKSLHKLQYLGRGRVSQSMKIYIQNIWMVSKPTLKNLDALLAVPNQFACGKLNFTSFSAI